MLSPDRLLELHAFVLGLLDETRQQIEAKMLTGYFHSVKDDRSEITEVDRSIELYLQRAILERFPEHGFIGEERTPNAERAEFTWYVDPIDGTQNFTHVIPTFGTIIALHHNGRPIVGAIDHPKLHETVSGALGIGAFLNGERLVLNDLAEHELPAEELVTLASPANFARTGDFDVLFNFLRHHPNVRVYGDCFAQNAAFTGKAGASVQFNVKPWDIAAAKLLIEEAGGSAIPLCRNEDHRLGTFYGMLFGKKRMVEYLRPFFDSFC